MDQHSTAKPNILIVGAGPTGLVLALSLARRGVPFRLIDNNAGPGEHSRAMAVHARTLEFYRQFGFAEEVVSAGVEIATLHLREGGAAADEKARDTVDVGFGDIGKGLSPYPFVLAYPQDAHERLLVQKLHECGGDVEWNTKLAGVTEDAHGVTATIEHSDGTTESFAAAYLCGCDGAHSVVREAIGVGFPGGTYSQLFYVADAKIASGFDPDITINLGPDILALMMPVRASGMQRLIGLVPPELSERHDLVFDDLRSRLEPLLGVEVAEVNWFSTYRVHHRVADHFQIGRVFLLGDAGHLHSPAGGQGMNTGIGDAINLGWKLASVVKGKADEALLATYETERIPFARALVKTTDSAFSSMVSGGFMGRLIRQQVAPLVFGTATRFDWTRHALFRTVSQIQIHYPDSALSEGKAGHVQGGDRLPWLEFEDGDNFEPLRTLDWQIHVYGTPKHTFTEAAASLALPIHAYEWSEAAEKAGFAEDAAYVVRPDGHVATALHDQNGAKLISYFAQLNIDPVAAK